jgi:hypothetical protein
MSGAVAPAGQSTRPTVTLQSIQAPVRGLLDRVMPDMHHVVSHDLPMIEQVSGHLLSKRGKLFRPTLALLASDVEGRSEEPAIRLASAIELMHLATLVHDDSVDHSAMRRGLPTVNALFSHQISVIMGDFLYSRALRALVGLDNLPVLRILTDVSNELAVGEVRQLAAIETLGGIRQADPGQDRVAALGGVRNRRLLWRHGASGRAGPIRGTAGPRFPDRGRPAGLH